MHINKWRHRVALFAWQYKRSIVLTMMFSVALLLSFLLGAPAGLSVFSYSQWPPELSYVVIVGFFICVVVVMIND